MFGVWKIVEGAISETSKVWQLDMFEQKGKGSTVVLYKQTILEPFSLLSIEWPWGAAQQLHAQLTR